MNKDIYFSHDANAMDDPKCMMLISQLGMEGYGIFWGLVEKLRCQPDYRLPMVLLPALAKKFDASLAKVEAVVTGYGLFIVDEEKNFFSQSLKNRMALMNEKAQRKSEAAKRAIAIRWSKAKSLPEGEGISEGNTNVIRPYNGCNTKKYKKENEIENKKEKSVKEKAAFAAPTLQEVEDYNREKGLGIDAEHFFDYYEANGWRTSHGKMKNWRAAVNTWAKKDELYGRAKQPSETTETGKSVYDGCLQ